MLTFAVCMSCTASVYTVGFIIDVQVIQSKTLRGCTLVSFKKQIWNGVIESELLDVFVQL